MTDESHLESTTLVQRLVLLGVTHRTVCDDATPHSAEVRATCGDLLEDVEADVVGGLSEADVVRRLNELEADRLLQQVTIEDRSPVGKGRPRYDLNVPADSVFDALEADERVEPVVERIRAAKE